MTGYTDREEVRKLEASKRTERQKQRHANRWKDWQQLSQAQMLKNPLPGQARLPGF